MRANTNTIFWAANLSTLFGDVPFLARFAQARSAGFEAVECQFPYEVNASEVRQALDAQGLRMVLINFPAGQWAAGERGIACHPDRVAEFRAGVAQGLAYAQALGVRQVHALAGIRPDGVSQDQAWSTWIENVRFAADTLAPHGMTVLVEPINTVDIPAYLISRPDEAVRAIEEAARPNMALQFDVYHVARMGLDVLGELDRHRSRIAHVQIADAPGRAEPGTGGIDFARIWTGLTDIGYAGHVGCEYFPQDKGPGGTQAGLAWWAAQGFEPMPRT